MTQLAHKIALDLTFNQERYFHRAAGTARLTWNWALAEWNRQYEAGEKPNGMGLSKQWCKVKYDKHPWLRDIHRDAHAQPFANLDRAFKLFFKKKAKRPRFKKKGRCRDSFYVANDRIRVDGCRVCLPKIGWVRMREPLRFQGKIMSAVVSRTANRWFVSISVEMEDDQAKRTRTGDTVVGVDVGIKHAVVLSSGEKIEGPKPLKRSLRRFQMVSRSLSRKQRGSSNRWKQQGRLARLHMRIANIRNDFWHKLTTDLCKTHARIGIESLNVRGMMRNRCLSRALLDVSFGMMGPMLSYKVKLYDVELCPAPQFYPSSKTCSACGAVNKNLKLADRVWTCDCGARHDRDINAAINLANLALPVACRKVTPVRYDMVPETSQGRNRSKSRVSQLLGAMT